MFNMRMTVICCAAPLLLAGPAHADDALAKPANAEARDHLGKGNTLYRVGDFAKAIEEYKAGALAEDAPVFLYNLGQCYRQLGQYEQAIWQYERFLSRAQPTGDLRAAVEAHITQMKGELEKKAMTQPPNEPGGSQTQPPEPERPTVVGTNHVDAWYADGAGWALAGSGLLATSVGGYLLLDAADLDDQANTEDRQDVRNQLRDKASTRRVIGGITGTAGVGLLIAGTVKLVLRPSVTDDKQASWSVAPTTNGVVVFGRF